LLLSKLNLAAVYLALHNFLVLLKRFVHSTGKIKLGGVLLESNEVKPLVMKYSFKPLYQARLFETHQNKLQIIFGCKILKMTFMRGFNFMRCVSILQKVEITHEKPKLPNVYSAVLLEYSNNETKQKMCN